MQLHLRQIRIPATLHIKIKHYCLHQQITLTEFYNAAIDKFIRNIKDIESVTFIASFKNGKPISLNIKHEFLNKLNEMAKIYSISEARIIHTALMFYLKKLQIEVL